MLSSRLKIAQQGRGRVALSSFINLFSNGNFFFGTQEFKTDSLKYQILTKASCLSKDSVLPQDVGIAFSPRRTREKLSEEQGNASDYVWERFDLTASISFLTSSMGSRTGRKNKQGAVNFVYMDKGVKINSR